MGHGVREEWTNVARGRVRSVWEVEGEFDPYGEVRGTSGKEMGQLLFAVGLTGTGEKRQTVSRCRGIVALVRPRRVMRR